MAYLNTSTHQVIIPWKMYNELMGFYHHAGKFDIDKIESLIMNFTRQYISFTRIYGQSTVDFDKLVTLPIIARIVYTMDNKNEFWKRYHKDRMGDVETYIKGYCLNAQDFFRFMYRPDEDSRIIVKDVGFDIFSSLSVSMLIAYLDGIRKHMSRVIDAYKDYRKSYGDPSDMEGIEQTSFMSMSVPVDEFHRMMNLEEYEVECNLKIDSIQQTLRNGSNLTQNLDILLKRMDKIYRKPDFEFTMRKDTMNISDTNAEKSETVQKHVEVDAMELDDTFEPYYR